MDSFDVIVIGQGYAGLIAAKLAATKGLRTANIEASSMGGLIVNINELDPVPAGAEHVGAELASNLAMGNADLGVSAVYETVTAITRVNEQWQIVTDAGEYAGRHVIVASGATRRRLGVPGEEEFLGRGVSECADCDGPFFKGLPTVVVGGGDSAFQEALALTQYTSQVTMLMRGMPRARAEFKDRVAAHPNIQQLRQSALLSIHGPDGKGVESVRIRTAGQGERELPAAGVFVFVGLTPNATFVPDTVTRDARGALLTSELGATNLPALWAIGAVRSGYGGLLTDAAADAERVVDSLS